MLRRDHPDDATNGLDEERIRADERARIEREAHEDVVDGDRDRRDDPRIVNTPAEQRVVEERVVERPVPDEIEVVRERSFSFGQLLTMLVGAALVVLGVFALITTGVETPLDQPVEEVMGYNHTPLLGIVEIVAGALLVIFSLRPGGRWVVALIGLVLIVGGLLVLAELDWTVETLGAERSYAWIPVVAGVVALVSALMTPRRHQRMTGVPTERMA